MKVLLISPHHPELVRGGAQQACFELFKALNADDDVEAFLLAGASGANADIYKSKAQIIGFDGREREYLFLTRDYDVIWNKLSDVALVQAFAEFLRSVQPDVVHFHHFISFGIDLLTLTRRILPGARIVFTFHEFRAICEADGQLIRTIDQSICTRSSPTRCNQCFPERRSEHFFSRDFWFRKHLGVVDMFTVPSVFMLQRYVEWGIDESKIKHIPNGQPNYKVTESEFSDCKKPNRFGFFGQLGDKKGLDVLFDAVNLLRSEGFTDFAVEVNGDNLQYASEGCQKFIGEFLAKEETRIADRIVRFNGSYGVEDLPTRMASIDWCVVPSTWPETYSLVLSEAWMFERPVIVSRIGALAERVTSGQDGLYFERGDARSLAVTIRKVSSDGDLWTKLRKNIKPPMGMSTCLLAMKNLYADARQQDSKNVA